MHRPALSGACPAPRPSSRMVRRSDMTTAAQRAGLGAYGGRVAARHLGEQGMVVPARNWRCEQGELDLVLRDGEVLVACEVKTRSGEVGGSPHEAVGEAKVERLH